MREWGGEFRTSILEYGSRIWVIVGDVMWTGEALNRSAFYFSV